MKGLFPPLFFASPFPFPFHEGIPLKESFPFIIPFLPFLPFPLPLPFPQKAVSCWSSSHAAKPLPFDLGRKPDLDLFPPFFAITFWFTFLEGPAVDTALRV